MFSSDGTLISASAAPHCGDHLRRLRKRYIVERTNKPEIRPEEQSQKTESCRESSWNENTVEKTHKDRNRHKNRIKGGEQARLVYVRHKA